MSLIPPIFPMDADDFQIDMDDEEYEDSELSMEILNRLDPFSPRNLKRTIQEMVDEENDDMESFGRAPKRRRMHSPTTNSFDGSDSDSNSNNHNTNTSTASTEHKQDSTEPMENG
eukprot:87217_1